MHIDDTREHVRLGLVGVGSWGEQVALSVALDHCLELVACYARTPASREAFAHRHGCRACSSYEDMLDDESIHGVVIMSPNKAHRAQIEAAAAAGKHVLVTKPIASSIEDGRAIIESCQAAGVILSVGHQSRREPALRPSHAIPRWRPATDRGRHHRVDCDHLEPRSRKMGRYPGQQQL